jgi:phosphatidylserine decarboxylase
MFIRTAEPVDGSVVNAWYHAGSFLNAALDKSSLENERNALHLRTAEGRRCDMRAGRRPDRAPILCLREAGRHRSRADSATASSVSARAVDIYLTPAAIPRSL